MDTDIKFLESLSYPDDKKLFEAAVSLIIHKSSENNQHSSELKGLTRDEKVKITKIYKFFTKACFMMRDKGEQGIDGLNSALEKFKERIYIVSVLKQIEFDKTLNNYRLIKMKGNEYESKTIKFGSTNKSENIRDFLNLEWKIEIILSSITMRKVKFIGFV